MASLVPNETVAALAPLHTNIQWLGIRPFQCDPDYVAFIVQTKNTQREFPINYRIIQPLAWRIACLIFTQLGHTTDVVQLHAARVQLDHAIRALNFAGQIEFPNSLFNTSQRVLKYGAINTAKRGVFTAVHQIKLRLSELTAIQLGVSAYQYGLNRITLNSVVNTFNIYRFAFHEKLPE